MCVWLAAPARRFHPWVVTELPSLYRSSLTTQRASAFGPSAKGMRPPIFCDAQKFGSARTPRADDSLSITWELTPHGRPSARAQRFAQSSTRARLSVGKQTDCRRAPLCTLTPPSGARRGCVPVGRRRRRVVPSDVTRVVHGGGARSARLPRSAPSLPSLPTPCDRPPHALPGAAART